MIQINIYYTGKKGMAKAFAEEMIASGIVKAIRNEEGNLKYDYFTPIDDENAILLIDAWTSQEALDLHHSLPLMQDIIKLREKYGLTMKVERYLLDEGGIPEKDKAYIK